MCYYTSAAGAGFDLRCWFSSSHCECIIEDGSSPQGYAGQKGRRGTDGPKVQTRLFSASSVTPGTTSGALLWFESADWGYTSSPLCPPPVSGLSRTGRPARQRRRARRRRERVCFSVWSVCGSHGNRCGLTFSGSSGRPGAHGRARAVWRQGNGRSVSQL